MPPPSPAHISAAGAARCTRRYAMAAGTRESLPELRSPVYEVPWADPTATAGPWGVQGDEDAASPTDAMGECGGGMCCAG